MTKRDIAINVIIGGCIGCIVGVIAINNLTPNKANVKREIEPLVEKVEVVEVSEPEQEVDPYPVGMWDENYTLYEVQLLASCVYAEAGSESDETQRGVASVILNRVSDPYFPDTIEGVIYQNKPLQYQCTVNGALNKYKDIYVNNGDCNGADFDSLERCFENTQYVLSQGSIYPSNVVYQSEFKQGSGVYKKINNVYFCYK